MYIKRFSVYKLCQIDSPLRNVTPWSDLRGSFLKYQKLGAELWKFIKLTQYATIALTTRSVEIFCVLSNKYCGEYCPKEDPKTQTQHRISDDFLFFRSILIIECSLNIYLFICLVPSSDIPIFTCSRIISWVCLIKTVSPMFTFIHQTFVGFI